jgi:hypothetical protein
MTDGSRVSRLFFFHFSFVVDVVAVVVFFPACLLKIVACCLLHYDRSIIVVSLNAHPMLSEVVEDQR